MLIFGPFLWSILPNFENPGKKDLEHLAIVCTETNDKTILQ
jgi:hypothetical protein